MLTFKPLSENELNQMGLLAPGIYDFEVVSAEAQTSKAGNQMIKLSVKVFCETGRTALIFDYLMESTVLKLVNFCKAAGLYEKYQGGVLYPDDCVGKTGKCKVVVEKDKTGVYKDSNKIGNYVPSETKEPVKPFRLGVAPAKPQTNAVGQLLNDDIPF